MPHRSSSDRQWYACALTLALVLTISKTSLAQTDDGMLYVVPVWMEFQTATAAEMTAEVARLRTRLPEGGPVRLGFTVYLAIAMERWDITTESEALANLGTTIAELDVMIARARAYNVPLAINVLTAIREATDAAQTVSQAQDRRNMQWYSDNSLATGWWTLSRYARRQYRVRQLYLQAMARVLANRMARYPETIVAASGDGEVELAYKAIGPPYADYGPFAVAEFRDWLRGEGLYGPGQPFAADAYADAARYRGDASPGVDTNGDGRTLNGDFGTSFSSWSLRYFDWQLSDTSDGDPRAIPESVYADPTWNPMPDGGATLFDAPRIEATVRGDWWQTWRSFRELMVQRYNRDFAAWLTTTPDLTTGLTIPSSRWYSYQIPADYLYGHSPANPDWRYLTSASAWRTADIRPYGGAGTTAFNTRDNNLYYRTLSSVAPLFASLNTRWAILEWNPSVPSTTDPTIYREEMALIEAWRPTVVAPFAWQHAFYQVLGSGFETALVEMIGRLRDAPWRLKATATGSRVHVTWTTPDAGAAPDSYLLEVGSTRGASNVITLETGSRSTVFDAVGGPGTYFMRVRARRGGTLSSPSNEAVLEIPPNVGAPQAPVGLTAVTTGSTITFNWLAGTEGPRPTGYVIEAGSGPGRANLASMRLGPATTFVITSVPFGTYHVRVRAETSGGQSAVSNEITVASTAGGGHCSPVDPPGPVSFRVTGSSVAFEWDAPLRAAPPTGYRLEAGSAPGLADIATLTLGTTRALSVTAPRGTYYLQLRAIGACGTSIPGPSTRLVMP